MFKKNLFIAFRSLKKDLPYSVTNVVGLSIGITCCLLILSFVKYELSFDSFNKKKDRIYRVNYDVAKGGAQIVSPSVPVFVGPVLKSKFPEVEAATRFSPEWSSSTIRHDNVLFDEKNFCYADPNFFNVFDFKPVSGNLQTALDKPNTVVITEAMAQKYFGKSDPVGQTLLFNNKKQFVVAAVMENVPGNSHFTFDFLTSFYSISGFDSLEKKVYWNNPNYSTFLLVKPNTHVEGLYKKIDAWVNGSADNSTASQNSTHLKLEALKDVHFNTEVFNFKNLLAVTDYKYIRIFITIAILILLIACANYINLSTAKASVRAKEVGIRKTIGASLLQLFTQFMAETFLLTLVAVAISVLAVKALLPYLNNLLGKQLSFSIFDSSFLAYIIAGLILISLLAGFYPALVLSRFKPVDTLKGDVVKTGAGGSVRKGLVIFQFSISVALILGTIIVRSQLDYMQSKKLGLEKDHVLIIHGNGDINRRLGAFADNLGHISGVQDVALTWRSPFETVIGNGFSIKENPTSNDDWSTVGGIAGDQHYLTTLGIPLVTGRNFDPAKIRKDSTINEFIVNEAFLRRYALKPDEAVGKKVILGLTGPGTIVGVAKDFHTSSMHDLIQPIVLFNDPQWFGSILLHIGAGNKLSSVLRNIENEWHASVPTRPFNYSFLDEEYDSLYRTEQRLGTLMSLFCGTAILVTCLGLLGLMAFIVSQRTKEIGIRKVLGASVLNITTMLSSDLLRLVVIAMVIACPVAWYFMHHWLQDFAYRVNISWYLFAGACITTIVIALGTISFQAIKAAVANPVKSLRNE